MTKIVIVGEAWGRKEAAAKRPFIGATGRELNRLLEETSFLPQGSAREISPNYNHTNIPIRDVIYDQSGIHLTNVFNLQPPSNRIEGLCGPRSGSLPPIRAGKYIRPEFVSHVERLKRELEEHRPNIIIALGAVGLWALTGQGAITKRRGAITSSPFGKVLPTYHPAFLFKDNMHLRPVVVFDLMKAKRQCEFPEIRRPERTVYVPENLDDITRCIERMGDAEYLSVDIETAGDQITCIGFAWSIKETLVIPIFDNRKEGRSYWPIEIEKEVWRLIRRICHLRMKKLFQNGLFDLRFLWQQYGIAVDNCSDDTMLLHHALQPEVQKSLGFLGSIYSEEPAWKIMRPRGKNVTLKREDSE